MGTLKNLKKRAIFPCNMTSAYNLNNSPRNYGRFYDSTKLGNLDGDILKHGLKRINGIQYVNKNHENDLMYSLIIMLR